MTPNQQPERPFTTFGVRLVTDDTTETYGFELDSTYVEDFWTAVLGPTAILLLRRISRLDLPPDAAEHTLIEPGTMSAALGLRTNHGRNSSFGRTVHRLIQFRVLTMESPDDVHLRIRVPTKLKHVGKNARRNWPEELQAAHEVAINQKLYEVHNPSRAACR